jgi:hypothetical protein
VVAPLANESYRPPANVRCWQGLTTKRTGRPKRTRPERDGRHADAHGFALTLDHPEYCSPTFTRYFPMPMREPDGDSGCRRAV